MTTRLAVLPLITAAWTGALAAVKSAGLWLLPFALASGLYGAALHADSGFWMPFGAAIIAFLVGTEFSRRTYAALIPGAKAPFLPLAHANLSVYGAFLFIGFFIVFFLMLLPGILMQEAGQYQLGKDTDPALAQEAFLSMLTTAYGAVFILCCLVGAGVLGWIALRLTLYGAATAATGQTHVFRSWGLTKGHLKVLASASLATHILPFALGVAVNGALHRALPDTGAGHFLSGVAGVIVFAPFLLAGHGLASAAWQGLKPAGVAISPPVSGD